MRCEWKKCTLSDIIDFNPIERLSKGTVSKKISMEKLQTFSRSISSYELSEYKGGTKFRNGDTIMARITPCLENGKTAQVNILDENEIGFGSTEFIVMRAKPNISDKNYIYYLSISPLVRDIAIKSMVGSSGRQRVQQGVLNNTVVSVPPLETQKKIASILSALDDKIELNNAINKNLEEQAQALFENMFGDAIANLNDNSTTLSDLVQSIDNRGKTPPLSIQVTSYPIIDVKALSGDSRIIDYNNCCKYVDETTYNNWFRSGHPKPFDILISTVGSLAEMKIFLGNVGCIAQNVVGFRSNGISPLYIYQYLNHIKNDLVAYNIGSVQPSIKVTHIIKHAIYVPPKIELDKFECVAHSITNKIFTNCQETKNLIQLRDTLLPKLMSGELDVSEIDI